MSNILIMMWMLSLGFVPDSFLETTRGSIQSSDFLVQSLGMGFYLTDYIHIYSSVELRETKSSGIYFDPFRGDFLIGGEVRYRNLSIGISHECNHDIVTNLKFHDYNGWEASFEKFYINYFMPISITSEITITPSVTLTDQFTERVRIKSNDKKKYFNPIGTDVSPNIFSPEFRLEVEYFFLRAKAAFQAGYAIHHNKWAHTQVRLGAELFHRNISLGLDYINRKNMQKNAGYSLENLTLFVRFRGRSALL
ncbi:MAG: hypothetical protein LBG14_01585 [Treponema sp.]|jgi:hypothetical protein|nr:hypothetical protein [Treponema sp.]